MHSRAAFSLVELSIVLVILGLLTGGILSGQSLIHAAELRAVTAEVSRYQTAARAFQDKYLALPGDMVNATAFWGDDNTNCPDAAVANGNPGTCNGNGDNAYADGAAANATSERFQFWKHLQLAGLVEGSYTGLAGSAAANHAVIGRNVPSSKLSPAGWMPGGPWDNSAPGAGTDFSISFGRQFVYGAASNSPTNVGVLKPEDAWNIDKKLDDGKPGSGWVYAIYWPACTDATNSQSFSADYKLSVTTAVCAFRFDRLM